MSWDRGAAQVQDPGQMHIQTITSRGGPRFVVTHGTPMCSAGGAYVPPTSGCPKGKIQILHLEGGSPEAAVDGVVSLRPRGSQGQLKFSRAFPLRGTHRKFHERSAPKSGGGLRFITPCGDVRFTFNGAGQPGQFHSANMNHIGRVNQSRHGGYPCSVF